jgi:hypothetical protein
MVRFLGRFALALALLVVTGRVVRAGDVVTQAEYEKLKKEVSDLRAKLAQTTPVGPKGTVVDQALDNKYGPNAVVSTRQGKLTIGGLMQVWYYSIQNDNMGWVDGDKASRYGNSGPTAIGSNEVRDNDSFAIRRAEIKLTMDIHENVTAVVMLDPAREAVSFPSFPSNQGNGTFGDGVWFVNPGIDENGNVIGNVNNDAVRNGAGDASRLLQDAYINYHGVIPHHDVSVGQMKRRLGEEGTRDSATLDFVERSMITQLADLRDLGIQIHGAWWDDRFQYWLGAFDGSGAAFQQRQNRADDNDSKDLVATVLLRPLWKDETWGSIELGGSYLHGHAGEAGGHQPFTNPVDGLNRRGTKRTMMYAWLSYMPGGPVKGWWMRGEWGQYQDRLAPGLMGNTVLMNPATFDIQGWYVSTGYKLSDSIWADKVSKWVKPMEFTFRYETMRNLFFPDLTYGGRRQDIFSTSVYTAGINYYIKGHNAKLQLNYNWVREENPAKVERPIREVNNDNFVVNFQVAW